MCPYFILRLHEVEQIPMHPARGGGRGMGVALPLDSADRMRGTRSCHEQLAPLVIGVFGPDDHGPAGLVVRAFAAKASSQR
jgi:hypothetical protein